MEQERLELSHLMASVVQTETSSNAHNNNAVSVLNVLKTELDTSRVKINELEKKQHVTNMQHNEMT